MVIINMKKIAENWWWISHEFRELSASYAWWEFHNYFRIVAFLFGKSQCDCMNLTLFFISTMIRLTMGKRPKPKISNGCKNDIWPKVH